MIEMTPEEIEYWGDRADEPLRFDPVIMTAEERAEFERRHPMPSQEEIERILREARE